MIDYNDFIRMSFHRFGARLHLLRTTFGTTQKDLGDWLGVDQSYIVKWEKGVYEPKIEIKLKIADYFKVSAGWVIHGDKPIFQGIVFLDKLSPHKFKADSTAFSRLVKLLQYDGAQRFLMIWFAEKGTLGLANECVICFKREDDLLLFLPYSSLDGASIGQEISSVLGQGQIPYDFLPLTDIDSVWEDPDRILRRTEKFVSEKLRNLTLTPKTTAGYESGTVKYAKLLGAVESDGLIKMKLPESIRGGIDFEIIYFIAEKNKALSIIFLVAPLFIHKKFLSKTVFENPVYAIALRDESNNTFLFRRKSNNPLFGERELQLKLNEISKKYKTEIVTSIEKVEEALTDKIKNWTVAMEDIESLFEKRDLHLAAGDLPLHPTEEELKLLGVMRERKIAPQDLMKIISSSGK
ncbi:MAG: transcriptional repressor DicA [Syntrophorhabdaceae bacterium PtaU1.Bin034]|nr:MAG: transcriptional repressor DicA [Syntrophorhabdaceae bacterium PtaU1.Bin034]